MRILIGYDGSTCSNAALADLGRAGLPAEAEAMVVAVGEIWLPPPASYGLVSTDFADGSSAILREARDLAASARATIQTAFPGWKVTAAERTGSPARQLLELADEWKPDLVVVGSHGRTGLSRVFMGSVSQKVVAEARCSVRIARGRIAETEPVRLLIGIDSSTGAQAAVRAVIARSWPKGSAVRLVTAIGPISLDGHERQTEFDRVGALHAADRSRLAPTGLDVSSSIKVADPRQLLLEEAEHWGADSIFLGAVGDLTFERFLFGTVVAAVTARAHCSVEVVREQL